MRPVFRSRRRMPAAWGTALFAFLLLLFFALSAPSSRAQEETPFDPADVPPPAARPTTALTANSYLQNCAPCHGANGNSDGPTVADLPAPPPRFADPNTVWDVTPAEYFHITKFGSLENLMPPWGNELSDAEIWSAVYFAMTLHTDRNAVEQGQTLYNESCAACHGENGSGDGPEAEGDLTDLSDSAALIQVSNAELSAGWNAAHREIGSEWTDQERRNVLDYVRTFTYGPPWESPYQPGAGVIRGTLNQGTPGGPAPANLPVMLYAFLNFTEVMSDTVSSGADGAFTFTDLAVNPEITYMVQAESEGITYPADFINLSPETPEQEIALSVYEKGDDDSGLAISRANTIIDYQPGALLIGVIALYSNQSDRTYAGKTADGIETPVTLSVPVPAEATDIQFPDGVLGGRFVRDGDQVWDTASVPPGERVRQIFVSYRLPIDGNAAELSQRWVYPVNSMNLLAAQLPDLDIEAESFTYDSNDTLENVEFQIWTNEGLPADGVTTVKLAGLPAAGDEDPRASAIAATAANSNTPMAAAVIPPLPAWVLGAVGVITLVLAGGMLVIYRTRKDDDTVQPAAQQDALLTQIAVLDDRHAAGEIDDVTWSQTRKKLKNRLLEVAQQVATADTETP
ncbi:MAG: c-type cytochrome [Caldilineaceae bacterium]|nr:c-type cytochrome [Caldilineaceae bacterium]